MLPTDNDLSKVGAMDSGRRWVGLGRSADPDSRRAGRNAAKRSLRGSDPALLIVFASGVTDPAAMLAGIEEACPDVPLIGCSSEVLLTAATADDDAGRGVAVTALGGPGFTVRTAVGECGGGAQRAGGAAAAACAAELATADGVGRALVLLTDAWIDDQEEILAGAYAVVGASMPMIGGSASPDQVFGRPYQLHGRDVLHEAAVGAVLVSDGPLGFGLRHGWRQVGEPMIVTHSVKSTVHSLDDRPAMNTYLERYAAPPSAYTDPAAFEAFAQGRPLGIVRRHGLEVRGVSEALPDGLMRASGEVPEGGLVWLLEGDAESTVTAAGQACREAVAALDGARPLGLVAFDCTARLHLLGAEGVRQEAARMVEHCGDGPLAGIYTCGEIARIRGMTGYHNQTLAVLAVG